LATEISNPKCYSSKNIHGKSTIDFPFTEKQGYVRRFFMEQKLSTISKSTDVLFMMIGAVMVFAMHGGFAFLEVGSVRKKTKLMLWLKF